MLGVPVFIHAVKIERCCVGQHPPPPLPTVLLLFHGVGLFVLSSSYNISCNSANGMLLALQVPQHVIPS